MLAWFRHMLRTAPPPQDAEAMLQVLRLSAARLKARNPEAAAKLEQSADNFSQAVRLTRQHGDAPTNDQLSVILSSAHLDIQEQFSDLLDTQKQILVIVQDGNTQQEQRGSRLEAALVEAQATFRTGMSALGEQVSNNEGRITAVEGRMDRSENDRRAIHKELADASRERATMSDTLARVETGLAQLIARHDERLKRAGLTEEQIPEFVDLLRDLKRSREAGDDASR
jgi:chromosome segregation ATPase